MIQHSDRDGNNLIVLMWCDKSVNLLINIHYPPIDGDFGDENSNFEKSLVNSPELQQVDLKID